MGANNARVSEREVTNSPDNMRADVVNNAPSDARKPAWKYGRSPVDPYGFERPEDFDYDTYEEFMSKYLRVLVWRASRWQSLLGEKPVVKRSTKLKRFIRKGIPTEHRTLVWMVLSGAFQHMNDRPGQYKELLNRECDPRVIDAIVQDLGRTFPDNVNFSDDNSNNMKKPLNNVLVAFANHCPRVGYCQGLNFVAGLLLVIVKDEEKVFWLMDSLLNHILPDYYGPGMPGLKTDQYVLGELVKKKIPDLYNHFDREGMTWALTTTRWFVCLFIDVLPIETVLRIWDCVFNEGSKVVFRVALMILITHKQQFLSANSLPAIVETFKRVTQASIECHEFMTQVFKVSQPLPMSLVQKLRNGEQLSMMVIPQNEPRNTH